MDMTNALITILESPSLPLNFDVTAPAAAALIAQGWTPPAGFSSTPTEPAAGRHPDPQPSRRATTALMAARR